MALAIMTRYCILLIASVAGISERPRFPKLLSFERYSHLWVSISSVGVKAYFSFQHTSQKIPSRGIMASSNASTLRCDITSNSFRR